MNLDTTQEPDVEQKMWEEFRLERRELESLFFAGDLTAEEFEQHNEQLAKYWAERYRKENLPVPERAPRTTRQLTAEQKMQAEFKLERQELEQLHLAGELTLDEFQQRDKNLTKYWTDRLENS
jgi:hypothetical protein